MTSDQKWVLGEEWRHVDQTGGLGRPDEQGPTGDNTKLYVAVTSFVGLFLPPQYLATSARPYFSRLVNEAFPVPSGYDMCLSDFAEILCPTNSCATRPTR